MDEEVLSGGRTTPGVVRVGSTVRRPASERSPYVASLLQYLESVAFDRVPRYLGRDSSGRDMLSFLAGEVPADLGWFSDEQLTTAAALVRKFHDLTAGFGGRQGKEVVCHGDLSPCNCVFREGMPYALIDFDRAGPGSRAEDVGYAAWLWLDLGDEGLRFVEQYRRLKLFLAAYGEGVDDPVAAILAAQRRLALDERAQEATREWAGACESWTLRHLQGVRPTKESVVSDG